MVNKVIFIGNLGRDPEVRRLDNGATVAKFSVATNESYKDKSGEWQTVTEWHDVIAWRDMAEKAEKLTKGSTVYLEGKLTHRTWEDKDGNKRKTTEVVASYFRSIGGKSEGSTNAEKSQVGKDEDNYDWTQDDAVGF
jgi:single-strand DNA-binding protein